MEFLVPPAIELHDAAIKHDRELRDLAQAARTSWVRFTIKLIPFHAKSEYEQLGMTWDEWLENAVHITRETADRMLRLVSALLGGISAEEIEKISKDNCEVLYKQVPEPSRFLPEVIRDAQTMSKPEFLECLKSKKLIWEVATPDDKCQIVVHCKQSLKVLWEGAVNMAMERNGVGGTNTAIEEILRHYLVCPYKDKEE